MNISSTVKSLLDNINAQNTIYLVLTLLLVYIRFNTQLGRPIPGFRFFGKEPGEWLNYKAKARFIQNGPQIVDHAIAQCKDIFQIVGENGIMLVMPSRYIDELRNDKRVSRAEASKEDFFHNLSTFSIMKSLADKNILQDTVKSKLTQSLTLITGPVNEENTLALKELLPATKDWKEVQFIPMTQQLVARVSSRIFLGEKLCRDQRWLDISVGFTINLMLAVHALRSWPIFLRPIVQWFLTPARRLRKCIRDARKLIQPEVEARRRKRAEAVAKGESVKSLDAIEWLDAVAKGRPFDFVGGQLGISFAAIHTTSATLTELLYDLIDNPEYIPLLRQEIVTVLAEDGGWAKTSLHKLKLMDSCMKESQRHSLLGIFPMTRVSTENITLSDGTFIPKRSRLVFPTMHMHDDAVYPEAKKFNGHRFLHLREQAGNENRYQFVTTSAEHIAFGHGQHACPGRFFASNEIKLILAHLIMKYDWAYPGGQRPKNFFKAGIRVENPRAAILYKSRTPEVDM